MRARCGLAATHRSSTTLDARIRGGSNQTSGDRERWCDVGVTKVKEREVWAGKQPQRPQRPQKICGMVFSAFSACSRLLSRTSLTAGPRLRHCTFAVTAPFPDGVNVQLRCFRPLLEQAPDQMASRLPAVSVIATPAANDAEPVLPTGTLSPAGFEVTRAPVRPVAVRLTVSVCDGGGGGGGGGGATSGVTVNAADCITPPPVTVIVTTVV